MHKLIDVAEKPVIKPGTEPTPDAEPAPQEACSCTCGESNVRNDYPDPPPMNSSASFTADTA